MNESRSPAAGWVPQKALIGAVLAAAGVGGLFVARDAATGAAYFGGLALFAVCMVAVFALISTAWGQSPLAKIEPLPLNGAVRWAVGGIVGGVAILGLFKAGSADAGSLGYYHGLALFGVALAYDFLLLKDWFDRRG